MEYDNELVEQPSWWKRNWKWAVPVGGCLTIIILFITVIGIGAAGIISSVKENTNHDEVLAKVQTEQEVIDALGEPIETNGIGSYNINISNGNRSAKAVVPIKGPKGNGEIYVTTTGPKENLVYEQLEVYIFDEDRIIPLLEVTDDEDF
ncbi:hypothetical protein EAX61_14360 [Dokdonia sinensis]|uniref:Cytochrome oxidase complex assembly protein 1 n=1 Tax=Dokdonia sinensis TaxID=2479847 RepID=A0A3M0FWR7_9FLAO|nr:cytochrome c oxidase assembly factor Coa1 family protein [Dokdonia sinensis]RMB56417.1 hypothetical protein EAX61_14360 [Dokdonia sinensis]